MHHIGGNPFGLVLSLALPLALLSANPQDSLIIYVAPDGDDGWSGYMPNAVSGRNEGPFASLKRARDEIRAYRQRHSALPPGGVYVYIKSGVYEFSKTLELDSRDSGEPGLPILYREYGDDEVRLSGGRRLLYSWFTPVTDAELLSKLPEVARGEVMQVDLVQHGLSDFGHLKARGMGRQTYSAALELFVSGRPMPLARWPNEGWAEILQVPESTAGDVFVYQDTRPARWIEARGIWLHGFWTFPWADSYVRVVSIDTIRHEIRTAQPHGIYGYSAGGRYYAFNILEELDRPGEWYLDRESGKLILWPPASIMVDDIYVSLLEEPLVRCQGAAWVQFQNLTFEVARGNGIEIIDSRQVVISDCIIRNVGNTGITIAGGEECGVQHSELYLTGEGGIILRGGDRITLTPARHFVIGNRIHHYAYWVRTYRPAVLLEGVGHVIRNNHVHDALHFAMWIKGNDHTIEYNEIDHVCLESGDAGAIYMGRDWTNRGNVIRLNYFHHIHGPYTLGAQAIYLDDFASGTTVFGNIFQQADRGIYIGGGRDNLIENNLFINCDLGVLLDARGINWDRKSTCPGSLLYDRLIDVDYKHTPWSDHYPELVNILEDEPGLPKGNRIVGNVQYGGRWLELVWIDTSIVYTKNNILYPQTSDDLSRSSLETLLTQMDRRFTWFKSIPLDSIGLSIRP
ncbi:right-handed parallel beta-helix repeat-containing protein [Candidatus Neomarinimicrobiota bacterium]